MPLLCHHWADLDGSHNQSKAHIGSCCTDSFQTCNFRLSGYLLSSPWCDKDLAILFSDEVVTQA